eukprot:8611155-Alexandrium_andersonii.AAC.1
MIGDSKPTRVLAMPHLLRVGDGRLPLTGLPPAKPGSLGRLDCGQKRIPHHEENIRRPHLVKKASPGSRGGHSHEQPA